MPPQRGQVWVAVPGAAPVPRQFEQRGVLGHVDRGGDPVHGIGERQVQCGFHVGAARGSPCGGRRPSPVAEQAAEEVAQVAHVLHPEGAAAGRAGAEASGYRPVLADLVVLLALLGITEDVVRRADLLEAVLGARVGVGVVLLGQFPVGARDLLVGGRGDDPEHLVVVLLEPLTLSGHSSAHPFTLTMAGRRTWPRQR